MKSTLCHVLLVANALAAEPDLRAPSGIENYYEAVSKPALAQDPETTRIIAQLAKSRVPAEEQACQLALDAFLKKPGLDAREAWQVSGVYRLGRDVPDFGVTGDIIWEVRVSRPSQGVSGVIWVSSSTGATRILFP